MRILFDQGTPVPLRIALSPHIVETVFERGWSRLKNGELLDRAEVEQFDVLVTTDQKLRYQQNLASRGIAILVLTTTSWPRLRRHTSLVAAAADALVAGEYRELALPK